MTGSGFMYLELAHQLEHGISRGDFKAGEKLPSLRTLQQRTGRSIATVYQAYMELEKRGLVTCHPRSGFVVNPSRPLFALPERRQNNIISPRSVSQSTLISELLSSLSDPHILPLACAYTSLDLMPHRRLARIMRKLLAGDPEELLAYEDPAGNPGLRKNLATWLAPRVGTVSFEDILITNGGTEAISLCLQGTVSRGDTIIIESPAYPGILQIMEELGLMALEVPTDPVSGMDLAYLEKVVCEQKIGACFFTPTVHNPMGYVMSQDAREKLVAILSDRDIPVIEDDTYGELTFQEHRPRALKSYDRKGSVIYLSSFSKIVGGGLRTGFMIPGRYMDRIKSAKIGLSLTTTTINQRMMAEFIARGSLDRHLRWLTNECRRNLDIARKAIRKFFPGDVRVSSPAGGFLLWVEMPEQVDSTELFRKAWAKGVSIYPGSAFSVTGLYDNCFRINCGNTWNEKVEKGFRTLGEILSDLCG